MKAIHYTVVKPHTFTEASWKDKSIYSQENVRRDKREKLMRAGPRVETMGREGEEERVNYQLLIDHSKMKRGYMQCGRRRTKRCCCSSTNPTLCQLHNCIFFL